MTNAMSPQQLPDRLELHNSVCNEYVAMAGMCGFVHLPTGRTCLLPARHPGPCQLTRPDEIPAVLGQSLT